MAFVKYAPFSSELTPKENSWLLQIGAGLRLDCNLSKHFVYF